MTGLKVLVIIPAYNEAGSLCNVVQDISENAPGCHYVIINDCSKDNTADVCKEHGLNVVNLSNNLGIGGAMQAGYKYAAKYGYDVAIQVDGDGQHSAKYIPTALEHMYRSQADIVIGSRYLDEGGYQSSAIRRVGIRYFSALIRLLAGTKVTDPTSGFRIVNRKLIEFFSQHYPADYPEPETLVLMARNGFKIEEISVDMNERETGKSSITPMRSIYYMVKVSLGMFFAATERIKA
jgi:hypothetical protein